MANAQVENSRPWACGTAKRPWWSLTATCAWSFCRGGTLPTIDLTPADVEKHAKAAKSNLDAKQAPDDILKSAGGAGDQEPGLRDARGQPVQERPRGRRLQGRPGLGLPEPGAGLIRDDPGLIAPTELSPTPAAAALGLRPHGRRQADRGRHRRRRPRTTPPRRRRRGKAKPVRPRPV